MKKMTNRKNVVFRLFCVFFLVISSSTLKSGTAIGFTDPIDDVWHSLANEKIGMPWMDINNVYTYGSSIVIECLEPILIEEELFIDFLILFSNDNDETNWEAAIHVFCLGFNQTLARWIIGARDEFRIDEWNLDPIGTHHSFL